MAEGGFDDFELEDIGSRYPEYDEMNDSDLNDEQRNLTLRYDDLLRYDVIAPKGYKGSLDDYDERITYIERLQSTRGDTNRRGGVAETSFTDNNDGKTVTITAAPTRGRQPTAVGAVVVPRLEFVDTSDLPENNITHALEDFIARKYKQKDFRLNSSRFTKVMELRNRTDITSNNNVKYKPLTNKNKLGKPQIVLKRDSNGRLQYNDAKIATEAVRQFKKHIEDILEEHAETAEIIESMPMVDITTGQNTNIPGLTSTENRELEGVLNPIESMDPQSRIGNSGALQIQADHFQDGIDETRARMNNADRRSDVDGIGEYIELEERATGLETARDRTLEQRQLEETWHSQEQDIDRFQKFKGWVSENVSNLKGDIEREEKRLQGIKEMRSIVNRLKTNVNRLQEDNRSEEDRPEDDLELPQEDNRSELEDADRTVQEEDHMTDVELQEDHKTESRYQKFKEFAKENMVGLAAAAISIAGIITTIIVAARKAILQGAQATSKFAKGVANLAKKIWPILAPILNIIAQAIALGAKGLAWLSSNLWVLTIAGAWLVYDQYFKKNKK